MSLRASSPLCEASASVAGEAKAEKVECFTLNEGQKTAVGDARYRTPWTDI